jgi:predicted RNase H-like nuclease (RuvC/YqgF family)
VLKLVRGAACPLRWRYVHMRLAILFRLIAVALFFGMMALATPAQDQNTDDVAAAARKAREQAKNAPKPKKVLTNDDIPSAPAPTAAPAETAAAKPEEAATTDEKAAENDPKSEAYWHKRFKALRDKIDTSEKELDVLQRELDKDQLQYYPDPQKALMQQHDRSDINDKTAKIDAKKKEIDSLNQQLSDLEDQLRKSGGDPGWAR